MWDFINGLFEFAGGFFVWLNCRRIYRDKRVLGVSPVAIGFFTLWGVWNLAYYPSLAQYWSVAGGVSVVAANAVWLTLYLKYSKDEQNQSEEGHIGVGAADPHSQQETKI